MRIALIVPELRKTGGTERCVASLGEALAGRGHRITVFASERDPSVLPGAAWYRVPIVRRPHVLRFVSFLVVNRLMRWWARVARGERFDVVHSTGPDVLRPDVSTLHACCASFGQHLRSTRPLPDWQRWPRLRRWSNGVAYRVSTACERYVVRRGARRLVAVSCVLARQIREIHGVDASRLVVIPNGVDVEEFNDRVRAGRRKVRAELRIPDDAIVTLFVGHNWERKGLPTLVAALRVVRERRPSSRVYLVVVGGGGRRSFEKTVGAQLQGCVRFLGTRSDMAPIYGASDLCVLPTTQEPFGLPVLEAMACGVSVIVSRCAGVAEVISDGIDGMLLDNPEDACELATKIAALVSSEDLRAEMGERAVETAKRYSWESIVENVETLYREVIGVE